MQFDINWLLKKRSEKVRGELKLKDAIERASLLNANEIVAILVLGAAHNKYGLLEHEQPFDVLSPGGENNKPSKELLFIPYNAVWDMLETDIKKNKTIQNIKKASRCRVIHISTPPPKEDNDFIKNSTNKLRGDGISISSASVRLKLWNLEMNVIRHVCNEWGIQFLPAPESAMTPDGYLKPEYYGIDATHANTAYGELVLRQLEKTACETGEAEGA